MRERGARALGREPARPSARAPRATPARRRASLRGAEADPADERAARLLLGGPQAEAADLPVGEHVSERAPRLLAVERLAARDVAHRLRVARDARVRVEIALAKLPQPQPIGLELGVVQREFVSWARAARARSRSTAPRRAPRAARTGGRGTPRARPTRRRRSPPDVARGLERFVAPAAPARDRRRRAARDPPDQVEAHGIAVRAAREPRLVARARLELRVDAEPLEELEHLGAVDQVARGGEVEARLAAAVFRAAALDLRVGLAREIGLVVDRPFVQRDRLHHP